MRTTTIWILIAGLGVAALFYNFSGEATDYPSGAPAGYTGSPGDGQNCTSCHNGTASSVTGWITSNIPASGYVAGSTYTITVTLTGTGKKGFEVSPQSTAGTLLGTLIAGTGNQLTGNGKYVTHSSSPTTNPMTWSFSWIAPAAGTGTVTFYGAFTVSKPVTKLSTLTVNEAVAPLTASASATPSTIVAGQTTQLNVVATGGTGSYTYAWTSVPPGFTSTLQNPVASPTVNTTYNVTVTSGTQTANSSAAVTVYQPLTAQATATPSTITAGESSQLNVAVTGGTGTNTYSWTSVPPGFTSGLQNPLVTPTETTTYNVTVTSGTQNANSSATVTVNQPIPLSVVATATPSSIMPGESSQLNATAAGGSGTYTYSWTSNPPGFTSNIQNPVVTPSVTTLYTVVVGDGAGTASDDVEVIVTLNPLIAAATADPSTLCEGATSQLNVTASGGSGNYTYSWTSVPPGFTSNLQNPVVQPAVSTQYIANVSDGTQNATSAADVTVIPGPTVSAGTDTSYCENITQFPVAGTAENYSVSLWSTSGDGIFADATSLNTVYSPGVSDITFGSVDLTLTVSPVAPCSIPASSGIHIIFDPCTGIPANHQNSFSVVLSPNPTGGPVRIATTGSEENRATVTIYDSRGIEILTRVRDLSASFTGSVDLSGYPKGFYFVRVVAGDHSKTVKLILM